MTRGRKPPHGFISGYSIIRIRASILKLPSIWLLPRPIALVISLQLLTFQDGCSHTLIASQCDASVKMVNAMLELAREHLIEITQAEAFAPIYVRLAYTPS